LSGFARHLALKGRGEAPPLIGLVEAVAALVASVVSPESAYIIGANLTVDGGTNA